MLNRCIIKPVYWVRHITARADITGDTNQLYLRVLMTSVKHLTALHIGRVSSFYDQCALLYLCR